MKQNLTHLVIVSDRSGSMYACMVESQNAINRMIEDQKKVEGECDITFVEFDDHYDVLYDGVNIQDVKKYELIPRGWTALYDAVGKAITTVGEKLANTAEEDRPALVTVIISTDGMNNASKEYTQKQIADMIKKQKEQYSWKFIFLGVEIDAESVASGLNIDVGCAVQVNRAKGAQAYNMTSDKLKRMRGAMGQGCSAQSVSMNYSDQEKQELK